MGETDGDSEALGDWLADGEMEGDSDVLGESEALSLSLAEGDKLADGLVDWLGDRLALGAVNVIVSRAHSVELPSTLVTEVSRALSAALVVMANPITPLE